MPRSKQSKFGLRVHHRASVASFLNDLILRIIDDFIDTLTVELLPIKDREYLPHIIIFIKINIYFLLLGRSQEKR